MNKPSGRPTPPSERPRGIVVLTVALAVAYVLGTGWLHYHLCVRTSEDAYAFALRKRLSRQADALAEQVQILLADIQAQLTEPAYAHDPSTWPDIADRLGVNARQQVTASGVIGKDGRWLRCRPAEAADELRRWTLADHPDVLETLDAEQQPWVGMPEAFENGRGVLLAVVPYPAPRFQGAVAVALSASALAEQCLAPGRDTLIPYLWLGGASRACAGHAPTHAMAQATAERREPFIRRPEKGPTEYAVMDYGERKAITYSMPVDLPGQSVWVSAALPYTAARLAPHALFKGSIILSAWAIPLLGILAVVAVRAQTLAGMSAERAHLKQGLDEAQARLLALIEVIPQAVTLAQPDTPHRLSFCSHPIESLTGYAAVELIADARLWLHLVPPDQREKVRAFRDHAARNGASRVADYEMVHRAGHRVPVRETLFPLPGASGGELLGLIAARSPDDDPPTHRPSAKTGTNADGKDAPADRTKAETPARHPRPRTCNVLLVDDDRLLVSLCTSALQKRGYGITPAYNGLEAVRRFKEDPRGYDVIVLDMVMPKMSGLEAIRHFKDIRSDVRIVGISGYSTDGQEWDLVKEGIRVFISKPFEPDELLAALNQAFESDTELQE